MTAFKSDFLNILQERASVTNVPILRAGRARGQGRATAYVGYDCTAPSLHMATSLDDDAVLAAADRQQADHA
jgi:tyrosyl-tRNA synthetase